MMLLPYWKENQIECGCDEVGRGCLAGPVVAAAVILPAGYTNSQLNDSKKLSAKHREQLALEIKATAVSWAMGEVSHTEIDNINILNASFKAMNIAIGNLAVIPDWLLIDGNRFRNETEIPFTCVVKGDAKYMSIAAASILAKTYRDHLMEQLHRLFPTYDWKQNKGYPTVKHREALAQYGASEYHRKTFSVKQPLTLF